MAEAEYGGPLGVCETDRQQLAILADTIAVKAGNIPGSGQGYGIGALAVFGTMSMAS